MSIPFYVDPLTTMHTNIEHTGIEIESRKMGRVHWGINCWNFSKRYIFLQSLIIWAKRENVWSGASLTFCSVDWICFFIGGFSVSALNTQQHAMCLRGLTAECAQKNAHTMNYTRTLDFNMKIPNYRVSMQIFPWDVTGYIKASVGNF